MCSKASAKTQRRSTEREKSLSEITGSNPRGSRRAQRGAYLARDGQRLDEGHHTRSSMSSSRATNISTTCSRREPVATTDTKIRYSVGMKIPVGIIAMDLDDTLLRQDLTISDRTVANARRGGKTRYQGRPCFRPRARGNAFVRSPDRHRPDGQFPDLQQRIADYFI